MNDTSPAAELHAAADALARGAALPPDACRAVAMLLRHQGRAAGEIEQFLGDKFQNGALDQEVHDALAVARAVLSQPEPAALD